MNEKEVMVSDHDAEGGPELPLSITPQLQLQTSSICTT
ncbi:hypothetical protein A2U01_0101165, partial [Trifolium medium]|nr:hypothetical protein [Trifolium medium]